MSVADILREYGIVPTVPTSPPKLGTPQTLVASHVPAVPTVPAEKHKVRAQPPASAPASSGDRDRIRAALLELADRLGIDPANVRRIPDAELALWSTVPGDSLRAYLLALDDTATRQAGKVPANDTAAIHCRGCGPVYVHPDMAAALPVVKGWPRALGCPWCSIRKAGGTLPRPRVTCETCAHYRPDTVNPAAGVGGCASGHGTHYPMQRHGCGDHKPSS